MSRLLRRVSLAAVALFSLGALGLGALKLAAGGGEPYPDLTTAPLLSAPAITPIVSLDLPPGNVATSADGRIFFNYHPLSNPKRFSEAIVFELVDGEPRPYPSADFQDRFNGPLGMTVDNQGRLWLIEPSGIEDYPTRLLGFDLAKDELVYEHTFGSEIGMFAQDLRISPDGKTAYLADTGLFFLADAALVVFDLETRETRRILEGHPTVSVQDWVIGTPEGPHRLLWGLLTFSAGVDGIALSEEGDWLYYAAMNHDSLYRVPTAALQDRTLSDDEIAEQIERISDKPLSDGISMGSAGEILITDVEHGAISVVSPTGELKTLARSPDIVWSDAVIPEASGTLLLVDSAIPAYIQQSMTPPPKSALDDAGPFHIYRIQR